MSLQPQDKPGLQAARTRLSCERTGIGFLPSGALLLLRSSELPAAGRTLLAVIAVLLALLVLRLGGKRGQRIRGLRLGAGHDTMSGARTEGLLIGCAAAGFAAAIAVLLVL
ncbi:MAG: DUF202 domain-containing protein [Candidatus Dormibacteria bacterium]